MEVGWEKLLYSAAFCYLSWHIYASFLEGICILLQFNSIFKIDYVYRDAHNLKFNKELKTYSYI